MPVHTDQRFPYYSDAFGCEVRSRTHLRELEQRHGVTPITMEDFEQSARQIQSRKEKTDRRLDLEDEMYERHPAYARYRELRARGAFTKHLPQASRKRAQDKLEQRAREVRERRTK